MREIWETEDRHFTRWLAEEENLSHLSESLGLELELEQTEQYIGSFKADIVCKDEYFDAIVLIENQLEKTDHKHLGQLFTYAAGLNKDRIICIWIAETFQEEHRAAIDWIKTINSTRILGREYSETKLLQKEYWHALGQYLISKNSIVKPQSAQAKHHARFAIGKTHCHLSSVLDTRKNQLRIELVLRGGYSKDRFNDLLKYKEKIENIIGESLLWDERPEDKLSYIKFSTEEYDPLNQEEWPTQFEWFAKYLELFYKAFSKRLQNME